LYNKPQGCSTSVALATGPNDEEEEEEEHAQFYNVSKTTRSISST